MANPEHVEKLKLGVAEWNRWREANPSIIPDFSEAELGQMDLSGANLSQANFSQASMLGTIFHKADLQGANLSGAQLFCCILIEANLQGANLTEARLDGSDLGGADLTGADLSGATMESIELKGANLQGAKMKNAILKETVCEQCAHRYEFWKIRTGASTHWEFAEPNDEGGSPPNATFKARVCRPLAHEADVAPCPNCGAIPAEMQERERSRALACGFLVAFGLVQGAAGWLLHHHLEKYDFLFALLCLFGFVLVLVGCFGFRNLAQVRRER